MELRENLAPRVTLESPFHFGETTQVSEPTYIKELVNWNLVLSSDHVHWFLREWSKKPQYQEVLPYMLQDLTSLLRDALDLMQELGGADEKSDLSYIEQPSISKHAQNRDFRDWTALIELTRDAWVATARIDQAWARHAAEGWWRVPYPIFKRLAFFAAAQGNVIAPQQALSWLLEKNCWWLWSVDTQREAIRLLVSLAPKLSASEVSKLEQAILTEPPREMFKNDLEDKEWESIVNHMVWLRLAKFQATGEDWGELANAKLDELNQKYPSWKLAEDERDEFPTWMGGGEEWHKFSRTPQRCPELVEWLKQHESSDHWEEDDWRQRCRDDFSTTSCALRVLAKDDKWLVGRWKQALMAWSEDEIIKESWRDMAPVLKDAPREIIQSLARELSWWLQAISNSFENDEALFLDICRRILELDYPDKGNSGDPVGQAINHPVGLVTEALLQWWYQRKLEDGQGLPEELKLIFIDICNTEEGKFRHGRILLSAHVIALYRVDYNWTTEYLLPLFDWSLPVEARAAWAGFLRSPRLYRPLLADIKQPLLEGAKHYEELDKHAEQFASFLTFVALDRGDTFTIEELADATRCLPIGGIEKAVQTLIRALEGAQDLRGEYWRNRILPYLQKIWPQDRDRITPAISESFAQLCVEAGEVFPEALQELQHWIHPLQHPGYIFVLIHGKNFCKQFPEDTLMFLDLIVGDDVQWIPIELSKCLDGIEQTDQQLANDNRFIRLSNLYRRHGIR